MSMELVIRRSNSLLAVQLEVGRVETGASACYRPEEVPDDSDSDAYRRRGGRGRGSRGGNGNGGRQAHTSRSTQQLLIYHVIATKKQGNPLPEFDTKEPFKPNPDLSEKAKSQINSFINGPEKEDPAISNHCLVGNAWNAQQLLICHVTATKERGNVFPELNKPYPANGQIQQFNNGSGNEDPGISKHYLVGKYGTNLGEIWAALATVTAYKHKPATIIPPATSSQSTSPSKRPRRSGPVPKYYSSDSDEPGMSRQDSNISDYMEQLSYTNIWIARVEKYG
ncbi:hypothetical protein FANTH_3808 [Fusarium anthophilum]|uniref:Uncharacterized protein n=1 Tax=Fusarium anthophilum TaxID=48485 RepID=A0A8H5E8U7_9HYPO|nr:hypothetical protein FANTH_3808 [Fusarium anthophilum]